MITTRNSYVYYSTCIENGCMLPDAVTLCLLSHTSTGLYRYCIYSYSTLSRSEFLYVIPMNSVEECCRRLAVAARPATTTVVVLQHAGNEAAV